VEVEEMINKVKEKQGRPFDLKQLITSCVANVIMNMLFGRRFEHSDPSLQQLISDAKELALNFSHALQLFPALHFVPYFKKKIATELRTEEGVRNFICNNIAACTMVCILQRTKTLAEPVLFA